MVLKRYLWTLGRVLSHLSARQQTKIRKNILLLLSSEVKGQSQPSSFLFWREEKPNSIHLSAGSLVSVRLFCNLKFTSEAFYAYG